MIAPLSQPVYLAVPSHSLHDAPRDYFFSDFADRVARSAVAADRVRLAVVEYCEFLHELAPLSTALADVARLRVSGFCGTDYRALFDGLRQLLEYDRYRFAGPRARLGRPLILIVAERAARPDDRWREAHDRLLRGAELQMRVLATTRAVSGFAQRTSFPPPARPEIIAVADLAAQAARLVLDVVDHRCRGISEGDVSPLVHRKVQPQ